MKMASLRLSILQKDKPYLQRTSQSIVKQSSRAEDSEKCDEQKRVDPSL